MKIKVTLLSLAVCFFMITVAHAAPSPANSGNKAPVIEVTGGTPEARVKAAFEALGGISQFVAKGNRVVVKPNIGWARAPEAAATTNPEVVAAVVKLCREAGAKRVVVLDHTCHSAKMAYKVSGIEKAAKDAGADVVHADEEKAYRKTDIPGAKILTSTEILSEVLDADVIINVPVAKVHGSSEVTLGMKNLMGIIWDRRIFHAKSLNTMIAELSLRIKPKLTMIDAERVMVTNGPAGPGEVKALHKLVVSVDPVAADAVGTRLLGLQPEAIPHIKEAQTMGIGQIRPAKETIQKQL